MSDAVLVAGITALATIVCQLIISGRSSSLIAYRVEMLEKKVEDLNSLILCMHSAQDKNKGAHEDAKLINGILPQLHHFSVFSSDNPIT